MTAARGLPITNTKDPTVGYGTLSIVNGELLSGHLQDYEREMIPYAAQLDNSKQRYHATTIRGPLAVTIFSYDDVDGYRNIGYVTKDGTVRYFHSQYDDRLGKMVRSGSDYYEFTDPRGQRLTVWPPALPAGRPSTEGYLVVTSAPTGLKVWPLRPYQREMLRVVLSLDNEQQDYDQGTGADHIQAQLFSMTGADGHRYDGFITETGDVRYFVHWADPALTNITRQPDGSYDLIGVDGRVITQWPPV